MTISCRTAPRLTRWDFSHWSRSTSSTCTGSRSPVLCIPGQGCSITHHETQGTARKSCPNCWCLRAKLNAQEARLKVLEGIVAPIPEQLAAARFLDLVQA